MLVKLTHTGGDLSVIFVVNGVTHVLTPGATKDVVFGGLPDGPFNLQIAINGVQQLITVPDVHCKETPIVLTGTAICNEVGIDKNVVFYWYNVQNPQATPITFSWSDGQATVPANGSVNIKSAQNKVDLVVNQAAAGTISASTEICGNEVRFEKKLLGQPPTGETYSIRSRASSVPTTSKS